MTLTRRQMLIGAGATLGVLGCGGDRALFGGDAGDDVDASDSTTSDGDVDVNVDGGVVSSSAWPAQTAAYLSALPRHTGFGMDNFGGGGRHPNNPTPNRTTVLFVDSRASGVSGSISEDESGNAIGY